MHVVWVANPHRVMIYSSQISFEDECSLGVDIVISRTSEYVSRTKSGKVEFSLSPVACAKRDPRRAVLIKTDRARVRCAKLCKSPVVPKM